MNWSATDVALVPLGVTTVTSTVPAAPAGSVTVMDVGEDAVMVARLRPEVDGGERR